MERSSEGIKVKKNGKDIIKEILMFILTVCVSGCAAFFYGKTKIETAGIMILITAGFGCVLFLIEESRERDAFLFDNKFFLWRFMLVYLIFLGGSILFPLLPTGGWPYLVVFTGLMLFSNQVIGMSSGSVLLMLTVLLEKNGSCNEFFIYFISGMVAIAIFSYINESFKVWLPILVALTAQFICLSLKEVLFVNEALSAGMFLIPAVNTMVCLILLLILLKFFSFSIIYKNRDRYMDINDPECPLLVELKSFSREEYYHAIHTAYLCDRIAKRLNLNDAAAKACGYYHKIGILRGESSWENTQSVLEEADFPEDVERFLKEYLSAHEKIISRETVVLLFSDTVISSISYLFSKEPKGEFNYEKLIHTIFKKKMESGIIKYSRISLGELQEMEKILVEEKLYYDFLR